MGADGRPVLNDEGYAIARFVYEASGQIERVVLLDEREKAVRGVDGFASYLLKRNPSGQRTEIVYYDERGNVTLTRRPGSAIRRWTVDGSGRVLERADYDPDGRPMMNEHGYSVMTFSYDEFGRETGRGLLDRPRRPLAMKVGVSKVLHGSVGADADLRAGDVVLTYAGIPVETTYQFTTKLELFKGDKARDLTIPRGDRVLTVSIPPGRLNGVELLEMAR